METITAVTIRNQHQKQPLHGQDFTCGDWLQEMIHIEMQVSGDILLRSMPLNSTGLTWMREQKQTVTTGHRDTERMSMETKTVMYFHIPEWSGD